MDAERIMERVRRLLAIANDPAASDNEQRIALEQAQRLMDRHAIEEWQLEEDHDAIEIIRRMIHLEANPCNWYMAELANIVALGNRCRASYGWRRAGNGRNVVCSISIYGARSDVDKTEAIWTAMETSRAAMWRERARTTPRAKANAAWRNGYYRGFQEEIARRYAILRQEMESDGAGREDRTGHARPSDSRRPARPPIGLWKSRKTLAKYHTCVIYLGCRQGIGQPPPPQ
ncbi:DUF2786 domain-containing protein [Bifidobacterium adolescentis]|uniref:DUF2786 domain-containing protein n=1 Tax=Bifidobacterium adolescentis TaxID=1680 RepID=UPI00319E6E9E